MKRTNAGIPIKKDPMMKIMPTVLKRTEPLPMLSKRTPKHTAPSATSITWILSCTTHFLRTSQEEGLPDKGFAGVLLREDRIAPESTLF
jgi:hypothetical protein